MARGLLTILLVLVPLSLARGQVVMLEYAPAPIDNPLKGLVPYQGDWGGRFPHSMEFNYVSFGDLVKGYDDFDWRALDTMLNDIASRGHQAVFRIYLEYPGKENVIPKFLVDGGLRVHKYLNTNTQPLPPENIETPDYEDPNLRRSLRNFIDALGKRYDGDPRIGFITAGLLGTWGEWHTYPRDELFASKEVQKEVLESYAASFKITPILLRYPAGEQSEDKASNADLPFGYHDDSFAWATLHTGKKDEEWFFVTLLKEAGPGALAKWKTHPIGGEIRPEAWGKVFDEKPGNPLIQNFVECVQQTHASWVMDSGMFEKKSSAKRRQRAEQQVRKLGYEFHVKSTEIKLLENQKLTVALTIENRGVAPFYYDWKPEWGLISETKVVKAIASENKLTGLLPKQQRTWSGELDLADVPLGKLVVAVRVPNALSSGAPLRFANATQDRDLPGWLSLGDIQND